MEARAILPGLQVLIGSCEPHQHQVTHTHTPQGVLKNQGCRTNQRPAILGFRRSPIVEGKGWTPE